MKSTTACPPLSKRQAYTHSSHPYTHTHWGESCRFFFFFLSLICGSNNRYHSGHQALRRSNIEHFQHSPRTDDGWLNLQRKKKIIIIIILRLPSWSCVVTTPAKDTSTKAAFLHQSYVTLMGQVVFLGFSFTLLPFFFVDSVLCNMYYATVQSV